MIIALDMPFDCSMQAVSAWGDRRDQSAASRLVNDLSPQMRGIARRLLGCPWMAEDAVQTAWMRLFQSMETHELRVPLAAWAVMIVKGVCANMLRAIARRPMIALDDLSEEELERQVTNLSLESGCEAHERLREVTHAISMLPCADRLILNLFLLEDVSPRVVARRAGLTAGALRTRICRIRSRLRNVTRRARFQPAHEQPF